MEILQPGDVLDPTDPRGMPRRQSEACRYSDVAEIGVTLGRNEPFDIDNKLVIFFFVFVLFFLK